MSVSLMEKKIFRVLPCFEFEIVFCIHGEYGPQHISSMPVVFTSRLVPSYHKIVLGGILS